MIIVEETLPIKLSSKSYCQKWDKRFLSVAKEISTWSKDPSTKVGAVAVSVDRRILAQGYNGFPSGSRDLIANYENREVKYQMVVHAEANIIYNACRHKSGLHDSTVFVYGTYPCPECIKALVQVGVARIVFQLGESGNPRKWEVDFLVSKRIMHELSIGFTHYKENSYQQLVERM